MRLTTHNGRIGRDGVYLASHNDRQFSSIHDEHIDFERSHENVYWHIYQEESPGISFEDAERRFYRENFLPGLQAKNDRYNRQRHPERMQTLYNLRTSPKTCPEESLYYIGSLRDGHADPEQILSIFKEFLAWREEKFPAVKTMNWALHVDEHGAPHIHERFVWVGHDKDGNEIVNQSKALQEMGVKCPFPDKPKNRYNNPKQTYTSECREKMFAICREHGLQIEDRPQERSKSGLSMLEYQSRQTENRIKKLQRQQKDVLLELQRERYELEEMYNDLYKVKNFLHLAEERQAFEIFCDRELEITR